MGNIKEIDFVMKGIGMIDKIRIRHIQEYM